MTLGHYNHYVVEVEESVSLRVALQEICQDQRL